VVDIYRRLRAATASIIGMMKIHHLGNGSSKSEYGMKLQTKMRKKRI
jgi:hypothetical protein